MELLHYWGVLRRHTTMIVLLTVSSTLAATAYSYMVADQYKATALVLVRPQEGIKVSSVKEEKELLNFPVGGGGAKSETPSNTYIEVLKSRSVAEKVVRALGLDQERKVQEASSSYLKRILGSLRDLYDDVTLAAIQIAKYGRILPPQTPFEGAVEGVQKKISVKVIKDTWAFEISFLSADPAQAAGVANTAARVFLEHMAASHVGSAKAMAEFAEHRLRSAERQLTEAREALKAFKDRHKTVVFKEEASEEVKAIAELESALAKADVKLAGLLKVLSPGHPKAEVALAERDRLLAALNARKAAKDALPEVERELMVLTVNVQSAEEIYQLLRVEHEQAKIREGMRVTEMQIAAEAVPPTVPLKPVKAYYAGGALSLALLIGIGLALLLEYVDPTIRSVQGAEQALQTRVLATLPSIEARAMAALLAEPPHPAQSRAR
ncbi:MAG: GumC family protein [Candidatus Rokuibacteriota bacterium]